MRTGGLHPGAVLRGRIKERGVVQVMAAHSPLSACLAEEAGFDGVWASGFELSALYGLADASLITMSEHLEMTRAIGERTTIPIIADIDTGFGNAVNAAHAVDLYERAGAAAVVIEDKAFPKTTSLLHGGRQDLVRVEEFQGKIEAAIATRRDPSFVVIARTEALIAGHGCDEALRRATSYEAAGADLILVHSKAKTPCEIERFCAGWRGNVPIVVVPTAFPEFSVQRAAELGNIAMLIYGNHALRACTAAMQQAFLAVRRDGRSLAIEPQIAPVEEIFRLQRTAALAETEARFVR